MLQFLYNFSGRKNHSYKVTKLRGYDRNFRQFHPRILPYLTLDGMCAEQTFAWQSRYKKVLNSMKKTHFHFVLHRLIKGRNRYTSLCYKQNRKPLLPSAKLPKKDGS